MGKMAIERCPRCDLNYVKLGMKYCKVCLKEINEKEIVEASNEVCPICGINRIYQNEDLCQACLNERLKISGFVIEDENVKEDEDSDDFEGMRLLDLNDDMPNDVKEDFEEEED